MKFLPSITLILLIIFSSYSCSRKKSLPIYSSFPDSALNDPIQKATLRNRMHPEIAGKIYETTPLFEYEISGLVVSCGQRKSWIKKQSETLNVMDAGIIWGENLNPDIYRKFLFETNGSWLIAKTKKKELWEQLDQTQISNNHLLATEQELRNKLKRIQPGSIITIKGCLVSYPGQKTSITRSDTGDSACETIWVDELHIVKDKTAIWHHLHKLSLFSITAVPLLQLFLFIRREQIHTPRP